MLTTITSKYELTKILSYFFPWNFSINLHSTGNFVKLFHIKATELFEHTAYLRSVVKHTTGETKTEHIPSGCSEKVPSPSAPIQC